jgi:hypothetical protein
MLADPRRHGTGMRAAMAVWAIALLALGGWAVFGPSGDDGWVLIAGALFAAEGLVSTIALLGDGHTIA